MCKHRFLCQVSHKPSLERLNRVKVVKQCRNHDRVLTTGIYSFRLPKIGVVELKNKYFSLNLLHPSMDHLPYIDQVFVEPN